MIEQLALFPADSAPAVPLSSAELRRRRLGPMPSLRRDEIRRHQREGRPIYSPLKVRDELRRLLASGDWVPFLKLVDLIDVGVYGLDYVIEHKERRGLIEARPRYYGANPLFPNVAPVPYQGFQFEYRLKTPADPAPLS